MLSSVLSKSDCVGSLLWPRRKYVFQSTALLVLGPQVWRIKLLLSTFAGADETRIRRKYFRVQGVLVINDVLCRGLVFQDLQSWRGAKLFARIGDWAMEKEDQSMKSPVANAVITTDAIITARRSSDLEWHIIFHGNSAKPYFKLRCIVCVRSVLVDHTAYLESYKSCCMPSSSSS